MTGFSSEVRVPEARLPPQFCGSCQSGWHLAKPVAAGWRRAHHLDEEGLSAWVTTGGAIYRADNVVGLTLVRMCNCVREHNGYPLYRGSGVKGAARA